MLPKEKANNPENGPVLHRNSATSLSPQSSSPFHAAACEALKLHFGKRVQAHDYKTFCSCITQLRDSVGNGCDTRMLDHYLWLTGMYMRWLKERNKEKPIVNAELLALFNKPTKAQAAELNVLLPASLDRAF